MFADSHLAIILLTHVACALVGFVDAMKGVGSWHVESASSLPADQVLVERQLDVFALDELPMKPVPGAIFVQGSLVDSHVCEKLLSLLGGDLVDHVLSDLSPAR